MEPKAQLVGHQGDLRLMFWCPGCQLPHQVRVAGDGVTWTWNQDLDRPTVAPSVRTTLDLQPTGGRPARQCHLQLTDGQITFYGDSYHELAGRTVPLTTWDW